MKNFKRFAALGAVILWGLLILATVITAFIDTEDSKLLFKGLLFTDIMLPVVIYAMMLVYRILARKGE